MGLVLTFHELLRLCTPSCFCTPVLSRYAGSELSEPVCIPCQGPFSHEPSGGIQVSQVVDAPVLGQLRRYKPSYTTLRYSSFYKTRDPRTNSSQRSDEAGLHGLTSSASGQIGRRLSVNHISGSSTGTHPS